MNPEAAALLEQLRDIHAAAPPGWWPPAPGWWVLAVLLAAALAWAARVALRRLRIARRRRAWLAALDDVRRQHDPADAPQEYLAGINRVFRAVALRAFPASACARLEGEDWVTFVRERLDGDGACLDVLARGPYQPRPGFDAQALEAQARRWVLRHG